MYYRKTVRQVGYLTERTVGLLVEVFTCINMLRNEIHVSSYNSSPGNITPVFTYC